MFGKSKTQYVQLKDLGDFMERIMSQQHAAGTTITIYINELHIHQAEGQQTFPALEMIQGRPQLQSPAWPTLQAQNQSYANADQFDFMPAQICAYCGQGVYHQGKIYRGANYHRECLSLLLGQSQSVNRY